MNKAAALLVSPEAPYPIRGGGSMRTASLLEYLAEKFELDVILFQEPDAPDPAAAIPAGLVRRSLTIPLAPHGKSVARRALRNAGRLWRGVAPLNDRFTGYEEIAGPWLAGKSYAVALLEHFWSVAYAPLLRRHAGRLILDLHNVESVFYSRAAERVSRPQAVAMRRFGRILEAEEARWLPEFDTVLVTSPDDARHLKVPSVVYPNALPLRPAPPNGSELSIAFSGNWSYAPNSDGFLWFRNRVWPQLRMAVPGLRLRLVGRNSGELARLAEADANIEFTGTVDDALPWIAKSRLAVVPIFYGSGTRVKIVEAWAAGLPVVATPLGAEGLAGDGVLLADDAETFRESVLSLLRDPARASRMGRAGRARYESGFSWPAVWNVLDQVRLW